MYNGIYGNAHTSLDAMDFTDSVPCMANQLKDIYKDIIYSEDLSWLAMNPFERIVYWLFEKNKRDFCPSFLVTSRYLLFSFYSYCCKMTYLFTASIRSLSVISLWPSPVAITAASLSIVSIWEQVMPSNFAASCSIDMLSDNFCFLYIFLSIQFWFYNPG